MATQTLPLKNVLVTMVPMPLYSSQISQHRAYFWIRFRDDHASDTHTEIDVHSKYKSSMWRFCHLNIPDSVTTVGATTHFPEVAVSGFFSGGGFSNYVSRR